MSVESTRNIEILLVEDSPSDRLMTLDALGRSGVINAVNTVSDGELAMAYLRRLPPYENANRPDLVLLDLNLPRKDGREVLRELKSDPLLKQIPVIVLTTSASDLDILAAYDAHANSYIQKPVDFAQFSRALSTLGCYWFKVVSLPVEDAPSPNAPESRTIPSPGSDDEQEIRVLLIEDSPTDALLIRQALDDRSGYRFTTSHVTRLSAGEELLKKGPFDLIITDLGLPDARDLEALRRIRLLEKSTPIVVLTGLEDDETGVRAVRDGAQDYLVKGQLTPRAVARAARYSIEKRQPQAELRRAQKLEAVGRLSAGIAHDFNNVLTVVRCNAESLQHLSGLPEVQEAAREIQEATERAAGLARQLLTFSRQQQMNQKAVDLNQIVGNFTRMLRRLLGEDVHLEMQLGGELPPILADTSMIEQILLNLAVNARDAMPSGGKVSVETSSVTFDAASLPSSIHAYAGDFVRLAVRDTGSGMTEDVLGKIFDPFFSTKGPRGTGLGLATVHGIVHQHHGWINVESRPAKGTTFEVFLPATAMAPERKTVEPELLSSRSVLIVDDEAAVLRLTARLLKSQGFRVFTATSPADARVVWEEHKHEIDSLLTDMNLSEFESGRLLAESLQTTKPNLKVVYMSGYSPDFVREGFELAEGENFVQKPFKLARLLAALRHTQTAAE